MRRGIACSREQVKTFWRNAFKAFIGENIKPFAGEKPLNSCNDVQFSVCLRFNSRLTGEFSFLLISAFRSREPTREENGINRRRRRLARVNERTFLLHQM